MQWLALSPHNKKAPGLSLGQPTAFLSMCGFSLRCSSFLPQFKDMWLRLIAHRSDCGCLTGLTLYCTLWCWLLSWLSGLRKVQVQYQRGWVLDWIISVTKIECWFGHIQWWEVGLREQHCIHGGCEAVVLVPFTGRCRTPVYGIESVQYKLVCLTSFEEENGNGTWDDKEIGDAWVEMWVEVEWLTSELWPLKKSKEHQQEHIF